MFIAAIYAFTVHLVVLVFSSQQMNKQQINNVQSNDTDVQSGPKKQYPSFNLAITSINIHGFNHFM